MLGFGRKQYREPMISFKTKFMLLLTAVGLIYIFSGQIMAHFGFAPEKPAPQTTQFEEEVTIVQLPSRAMVVQNATVFKEPGRKPYATVAAGQPVSVLDVEDTGQAYITVRHNGMAGYMSRRDLALKSALPDN